MKNILENIKHIGIISRWFKIKGYEQNETAYFADRVKLCFPEYRDDPHLEEKIKTILTLQ